MKFPEREVGEPAIFFNIRILHFLCSFSMRLHTFNSAYLPASYYVAVFLLDFPRVLLQCVMAALVFFFWVCFTYISRARDLGRGTNTDAFTWILRLTLVCLIELLEVVTGLLFFSSIFVWRYVALVGERLLFWSTLQVVLGWHSVETRKKRLASALATLAGRRLASAPATHAGSTTFANPAWKHAAGHIPLRAPAQLKSQQHFLMDDWRPYSLAAFHALPRDSPKRASLASLLPLCVPLLFHEHPLLLCSGLSGNCVACRAPQAHFCCCNKLHPCSDFMLCSSCFALCVVIRCLRKWRRTRNVFKSIE